MKSLGDLSPAELLDIPFLPLRHFARATNTSPNHTRNKINAGKLEAVKDGDLVKIVPTPRAHMSALPPWSPGHHGRRKHQLQGQPVA